MTGKVVVSERTAQSADIAALARQVSDELKTRDFRVKQGEGTIFMQRGRGILRTIFSLQDESDYILQFQTPQRWGLHYAKDANYAGAEELARYLGQRHSVTVKVEKRVFVTD